MDKERKNEIMYNYKLLINRPSEYFEDEKKSKELLLNKFNKRKIQIQVEIYKLINKNMENIEQIINNNNYNNTDGTLNINTSKSLDPNFQNYSGEKLSIVTYPYSNNQTLDNKNNNDSNYNNINEDKNKNNKNIINKKNKRDIKNDKIIQSIKTKNINNIINNNNNNKETITEKETLINSSNFSIINENSDKDSSEEENRIILTGRKTESKIRNIFISENIHKSPNLHNKSLNDNNTKTKIFFKDKNRSLSPNYSLFDSTSTSNTYEKHKNKFKFHKIIDDSYNINTNIYLKYNKSELINFFSEINLPSIYAHKFIENGFDDLNVILMLTKTSITITNKNLKDIGIMIAGHRAQILIHLEERAELFPFDLEKNIIYNNKYNKCNKFNDNIYNIYNNDSLFQFLNRIGCQKYVINFRRNGYYNCELLFSQMFTREPITKEMLIEDFSIENEEYINKILKSLTIESLNYIKRLKRNNIKVIFDNKKYRNSCQPCLIF